MLKPHSKAWYAQLAAKTGVYEYPWTQNLSAPGGEELFDVLLEHFLTPETNVLEAGCGHGRDAKRYVPQVRSYTGYDFTPPYVERAEENAPQAEFVVWDSKREPIPAFGRRFDLVMSRRGPTSVIPHLPELCVPGARVLCIHPEHGEARVKERLAQLGLEPQAEWRVRVKGFLSTLEDFVVYRQFHGDGRSLEELHIEWDEGGKAQGFPVEESRYIYLAQIP